MIFNGDLLEDTIPFLKTPRRVEFLPDYARNKFKKLPLEDEDLGNYYKVLQALEKKNWNVSFLLQEVYNFLDQIQLQVESEKK